MKTHLFDKTIREAFRLPEGGETGAYGLEIEVEGRNLVKNSTELWRVEADSSLRGEAREYVLNGTRSLKEVQEAVLSLYRSIAKNDGAVSDSMRAGIHVHLNLCGYTVRQAATFLCLYWILENIVVRTYAGRDRSGNSFCVKLREAEYLLLVFSEFLTTGNAAHVAERADQLKYGAANWSCLARYGSLEFRSLRTPTTPEPVLTWIQVLTRIQEAARGFSDPLAIVSAFSDGEADAFARRVLGDFAPEDIDSRDVTASMRRVQSLAFDFDWSRK